MIFSDNSNYRFCLEKTRYNGNFQSMRGNSLNNRQYYTAFLRRYVISLFFICFSLISIIGYSFYVKFKEKEKHTEVKVLISQLKAINESVDAQITDGYVDIHDIFLNFGDFQDQTAKFVGINDIEIIDSLSRIGSVIKYFDIEGKEKHAIEILHFSDKIDDLLLTTDEHSLFIKGEINSREITQEGKNFSSSWFRLSHLLERAFISEQHDLEMTLANYKNRIYISCLVFIAVLLIYIFVLFFIVYFKILKSIKILRLNTMKLTEGRKPSSSDHLLIGETEEIQSSLNVLYSDYKDTQTMLSQMYSDNKMDHTELENHKDNVFFDSITKLHKQLEYLEIKERDRNWNIDGLNQLTDVVNKFSSQPKTLFKNFIQTLVKYLGAVQGGFFIKETDDVLSLETSYAFDRIKKTTSIINKGEGIIGEVWEEEQTLYLENISSDHFKIKSALGEARPVAIIISPLMERGICYGILEISSFEKFNENKKKFIETACEILASATANVMINQTTKVLLKDSQKLTEKLKTQEEEKQDKINLLSIEIESERKKLFLKDSQIKELNFSLHQQTHKTNQLKEDLTNQKQAFEKELKLSLTNNSALDISAAKIIELEAIKEDLEETLRIRNLKIDRLKKKLTDS